MRRWTTATIIEAFRAYHARTGEWPAYSVRARDGLPSAGTVRNHLGGWGAALVAAGDAPRPKARVWTRDQAIAALRDYEARTGRTPTFAQNRRHDPDHAGLPSHKVIKRLFGSVMAAREAAGLANVRSAPGTPLHLRPLHPVSPVAATIDADLVELESIAQTVACMEDCDIEDARDALQNAWLALARDGHDVREPLRWLHTATKIKVRQDRGRERARRFALVSADRDDRPLAALSVDPADQIEARLQLAELVERCKLGDNVLHVVADMEREALNLYEPIAQRRDDGDWLEELPAGRWRDKLRQAIDAGQIPCVCWEHVREAGITPPPELAQHFPDCMGDRHGTLGRRRDREPTFSPAMRSIFEALDDQQAVAA